MFRMWGRIIKENHTLQEITIEDDSAQNRTRKVFHALTEICLAFDLEEPQWLNGNIAEFGRIGKTRFTKDCFIEAVDFDFLEIYVIEED